MQSRFLRDILLWLASCCLVLAGLSASSQAAPRLKVAAFNIRIFGISKVNKPAVTHSLLSILNRYDLVFIQEIRDDENTAIFQLRDALRERSGKPYELAVSPRLGRGDMKEQYAYIYDPAKVSVINSYVFDDKDDHFEREPYIARFQAVGADYVFTLAGIHVTPRKVKAELQALNLVYRDAKDEYGDANMLILGDMNAACDYYEEELGFQYFDEPTKVLVADDEDTTVAQKQCAYDRVLAFGDMKKDASQAYGYNFQKEHGLTLDEANAVSDHYPVEFTIKVDGENTEESILKPLPLPVPAKEMPRPPRPVCAAENYLTPKGYCMGIFPEVGKRRVSRVCCPAS